MTYKLTMAMATREFVRLMSTILHSQDKHRIGWAVHNSQQQRHVDFQIDPKYDFALSIDNFSDRFLMPAAYLLANRMMNVVATHELTLTTNVKECNRASYDSIHVRSVFDKTRTFDEHGVVIEIDCIRFDILYSGAALTGPQQMKAGEI